MKNKKKKKMISASEDTAPEVLDVTTQSTEAEEITADESPVAETSEPPEAETHAEVILADGTDEKENGDDAEENSDAEDEKENVKPKEKHEKSPRRKGDTSPVKLIVTLAAVCVAIAVLLGGVNLVTRARISKAAEKEKTEAILSVFKGGDSSKLVKSTDNGDGIHLVYKGKNVIGYCVFTAASGFGGDISMIVGIDTDYSTCGVKIISMSETPGVGTKTNTLDFLDRFIGKSHSAPTDGVEAISGATISSEAIKSAVAAAHKIDFDLEAAAKAEGAVVLTPSDTEKEEDTSVQTTPNGESSSEVSTDTDSTATDSASDSVDPTETVDTSEPTEETSDIPYPSVENGWEPQYVYGVGVGTSFDRYVIEVTKVTDESGEIILDPVEVTTETPTEAPTAPPTEAPTSAPVVNPPTSETTGIHSIPLVTTSPESSGSPMGSASVPSSEIPSEPESSETTPVDTTPADPTPTTPVSPDTDDPSGNRDPIVQPGISIGGHIIGQN